MPQARYACVCVSCTLLPGKLEHKLCHADWQASLMMRVLGRSTFDSHLIGAMDAQQLLRLATSLARSNPISRCCTSGLNPPAVKAPGFCPLVAPGNHPRCEPQAQLAVVLTGLPPSGWTASLPRSPATWAERQPGPHNGC